MTFRIIRLFDEHKSTDLNEIFAALCVSIVEVVVQWLPRVTLVKIIFMKSLGKRDGGVRGGEDELIT